MARGSEVVQRDPRSEALFLELISALSRVVERGSGAQSASLLWAFPLLPSSCVVSPAHVPGPVLTHKLP